jgi:hypothetical protein
MPIAPVPRGATVHRIASKAEGNGRHRGRSSESDPLAYLVKDAVMTSQEGTRDNLGPQDRVIECVDCWKQFVFTARRD